MMPKWLQYQMRTAYLNKDVRQIRLLNDCWFFYRKQNDDKDIEVESSSKN